MLLRTAATQWRPYPRQRDTKKDSTSCCPYQYYLALLNQLQRRYLFALLALADGLEVLVLELRDGGLHGPRDGFTVGADRAASHLVRDVEQQRNVGLKAASGRDAFRNPTQPKRTFAARRALAAGFMGIESIEVGEGLDHLDRVIDDDGAAGAEAGAAGGDAVRVERNIFERPVEFRTVSELAFEAFAELQDLGRRATRNNRFEFPSVERAAAEVVEKFAEGGFAGFDFVKTWAFHQAADAPDMRAAVARDANLGELRATEGEHVFHLRHRLRIIDDGGAVVEAEDGGEIGRLDARVAAFAFERFDQAGLFAADIATSATVDDDFAGIARAEDVVAEETLGLRFGDRAFEDLGPVDEFAADIDKGLLSLDGPRGDRDTLQHLVRVFVDDLAVLVRARFGFVGVDDKVSGLAGFAVEKLPFHPGREAGAAAAAQARQLDFFADFFGLKGDGFLECVVAAVLQVAVEVDRVSGLAEISVNQRAFDGRHVA